MDFYSNRDGAEIPTSQKNLTRILDWKAGFWIGLAPLAYILFAIGNLAGYVGELSFLVWIIISAIAILHVYVYAKLALCFPSVTGGIGIFAGIVWGRYSTAISAISSWSYFLGWSSSLALYAATAGALLLNFFAPLPDEFSSEVINWLRLHGTIRYVDEAEQLAMAIKASYPFLRDWSLLNIELGWFHFSLNFIFFVGLLIYLTVHMIQSRGFQYVVVALKLLGWVVLGLLLVVAVTPFFTGKFDIAHFSHLVPLKAMNSPEFGSWNADGWRLFISGLLIATSTSFSYEVILCFNSEYKNPKRDIMRAYSVLSIALIIVFSIIPIVSQGFLTVAELNHPMVLQGWGIGDIIARMVGNGADAWKIFGLLSIAVLLIGVFSGIEGTSRTLYQAGKFGWFPRFLARTDDRGVPGPAILCNFVINTVFLSMAAADWQKFTLILIFAFGCYQIVTILTVLGIWILRMDAPNLFEQNNFPKWLIWGAILLSIFDIFILGAGLPVYDPMLIWMVLAMSLLILPFHYWRRSRDRVLSKFEISEEESAINELPKNAGNLPYIAIGAACIIIISANYLFSF